MRRAVIVTLLVGSMGATASAAEPDWCQGYQPWGAAGAKAGVTVNNLKDNINDVGPGLFWIAANVGCEFPKDAKAQQATADAMQSITKAWAMPDKDIKQVFGYAADHAKFADGAKICKITATSTVRDSGLSAYCNKLGGATPYLVAYASDLALRNGGLDGVSQTVLPGLIYNFANDGDAKFLLGRLDRAKLETDLAAEPNVMVKARALESFYEVQKRFAAAKSTGISSGQNELRWKTVDAAQKDREVAGAIAAVKDWVTKAIRASGYGAPIWQQNWKPVPVAECDAAEALLLKLVPTAEPMSRLELYEKLIRPERIELIDTLKFCAHVQGFRQKGDALGLLSSALRYVARDPKFKLEVVPAEGDYIGIFKAEPFPQYDYRYYSEKTCDYQNTQPWFNNDGGQNGGGIVASLKDGADGTVVTFKKAEWMEPNMVCREDGTWTWDAFGSLIRGRSCKQEGMKKMSYQEDPLVLPKGAKVPSLKVGAWVATVSARCGEKPGAQRPGFPWEVYPTKQMKVGQALSFLWWPMKTAGKAAAGGATASAKPAAKGKKK